MRGKLNQIDSKLDTNLEAIKQTIAIEREENKESQNKVMHDSKRSM